jgi:hypothetical protein
MLDYKATDKRAANEIKIVFEFIHLQIKKNGLNKLTLETKN